MTDLAIVQLGRMEYGRALTIQRRLQQRRIAGETGDVLLVVEHPPVLTMGKRARDENVLASPDMLASAGIDIVPVERGGDVTYHGPGQMVGYPIIHLGEADLGIRVFVEGIERTFIDMLAADYGIEAHARSGVHTGVWVEDKKITAIGLSVSRSVTMHGFAFNINTDLGHFDFIVPCGLTRGSVTSLERITGRRQDFDGVCGRVVDSFCRIFHRIPVEAPLDAVLPEGKDGQP